MNKQVIFAPSVTGTKTVSLNEFFEYIKSVESAGDEATLYATVAWIYRCLQIRCNAIAGLPHKVYQGEREVSWKIPLKRLLRHTEAALSMWGASYWLKEQTRQEVTGLRWLNPISMRAETSEKGVAYFEQTVNGKVTKFKPERIVYIHSFNPSDDLGPGISPLRVALEAGGLARNANLWAASYFENSAVPAVLLTVEGRIDKAETERVSEVWDRVFGGVRKAFRTAVLGLGMKPTIIGSAPKDIAMSELLAGVRQQVAVAFGIPEDLLSSDAANYATAREHRKSLYTETILPEAELIAEDLNDQLFGMLPRPLTFKFEPEGLEIMQQEETDRSQAVLRLVQAGMPLESALTILGYDIPEGVDVTPTVTPATVPTPQFRSWREDLKLWEKKSLRYLGEHGQALCPFESKTIPYMIKMNLMQRLELCETAEEVKSAFALTFQDERETG